MLGQMLSLGQYLNKQKMRRCQGGATIIIPKGYCMFQKFYLFRINSGLKNLHQDKFGPRENAPVIKDFCENDPFSLFFFL